MERSHRASKPSKAAAALASMAAVRAGERKRLDDVEQDIDDTYMYEDDTEITPSTGGREERTNIDEDDDDVPSKRRVQEDKAGTETSNINLNICICSSVRACSDGGCNLEIACRCCQYQEETKNGCGSS